MRGWGSPRHSCAGTGLAPAHICAGTGLTPAHICAGTGGPLRQMPSCGGDHLHPAQHCERMHEVIGIRLGRPQQEPARKQIPARMSES
jgi:hypothetical protein